MRYYSFPYEGTGKKYDASKMRAFDDAYSALASMNEEYNTMDPDSEDSHRRLLVVLKENDNEFEYAFFQFTSGEACREFIKSQKNIVWSKQDEEQMWNGDAGMMGISVSR